jgi:DNA polymerase-3 subunit delta
VVALKKTEIEPFLTRPDPRRPIVLIYGPDLGLVRERADALVRAAAPAGADDFSLIKLDGDTVAADPGRLVDEARTIGLFGGRRVIRVRAGGKNLAEALKPLLAEPPQGSLVVIEAGDLRKNAPLRTLCEASPAVAAIPCYVDSEADLARLVDKTLAEAKIRIEPDAHDALLELLGADRLATRAELEKLVLYAGNGGEIRLDDVRLVIADASALVLDDVVDAAAAGEEAAALAALEKTRAAGTAPATVIGAAIRHVATLHRLSLEIERGAGVEETVKRAQPPIHFRRHKRAERALARFRPPALAETLIALGQGSLAARRQPGLADAIVERAMLQLARRGKRVRGSAGS